MVNLGSTVPYYGGGQVANPANVIETSGAPSSNLKSNLGTLAVDNATGTIYGAASHSGGVTTWAVLGGGTGAVATLTGDTGTATPVAGNIKIAGTANQITTTASGSTVTASLPSAITAPGSLTTTTTLAATTTVTAGTGITSTTGNIAATAGNVTAGAAMSATTTVTAGTGITSTTGNIVATAGAVNAGTSMTATLGNITATNGNFVASTSGTGLSLPVVTASGAASGTVNCNGRVGSVTFTSVSIASNADLTLTMGNTSVVDNTKRVLFSMSGATTGSALSVKSATPGTNQFVWVITNGDGAAIVTSTADITFDFIVLN